MFENKVRRVRLKDGNDVRRYLSWLAKNVEAGNVDLDIAKTLNSIMRTLLKAIETLSLDDLDKRLAELETAERSHG